MKLEKIYLILFVMLFVVQTVKSQEKGGCDLCGPASGSGQNVATGNYSATIGASCESTAAFSFSVGYYAKANASSAMALGRYVKAKATNAMVIGSGTGSADAKALVNTMPNSLMIGFNSSVPTLYVSNSSGFNSTGKVGIGNITSPKSKLHIRSDVNEDASIILEPSSDVQMAYFQLYDDKHKIIVDKNHGMEFRSQNDKMLFNANNIDMNAKLSVTGGILTSEVHVKEVSEWYDRVFESDYDLKPIEDLEAFIKENGHLPDLPSEEIVMNEGYALVEMDGLLLKKIEELTLYAIELHKLIERQQEIIECLQSK